ncbi:MAG: hypothetical protein M3P45_01195, partial [Acidobacteriota bacterium]|nr:hypothetical protein [Acidobacteriota bacterium]
MRECALPGSRVLVPFRNKSMVGVVTDWPPRPPANKKIREITKTLDILPALTPALLDLGHWIAGYYLAPIGEVFRAMLPPITELRAQPQIVITEPGKRLLHESVATLGRDFDAQEISLLSKMSARGGSLPAGTLAKIGSAAALIQRLNRRGLIEIRQSLLARKQR